MALRLLATNVILFSVSFTRSLPFVYLSLWHYGNIMKEYLHFTFSNLLSAFWLLKNWKSLFFGCICNWILKWNGFFFVLQKHGWKSEWIEVHNKGNFERISSTEVITRWLIIIIYGTIEFVMTFTYFGRHLTLINIFMVILMLGSCYGITKWEFIRK